MSKKAKNNKSFETFVVFDLETDGLPSPNRWVSITELCMFAVSRTDFIDSSSKEKKCIPRILHKLNLVFQPLGEIDQKAQEITGFSNSALEKESHFNDGACDIINIFLKRLQQPVCLVAHFGNGFDFKIIMDHFKKQGKSFPEGVISVDSLGAFKFIDRKLERELLASQTQTFTEEVGALSKKSKSVDLFESLVESENTAFQKINEITPKGQKIECTSSSTIPKAKRPLFEATTLPIKRPWFSYKLVDVFTRKTGEEPVKAHEAAGDVEMLLKCMLHYGKHFVEYTEQNAADFQV